MKRRVVRRLAVTVVFVLAGSPCLAADGLAGGLGVGVWRFTAPSPAFETVVGGAPNALTLSVFGEYGQRPYFGGLRIGYLQEELPNGFRNSRVSGERVVVNDPSVLRVLPVTLEIGLETGGRWSARGGVGFGFASVWHQFLPSAFVHAAAEDGQSVSPVIRLAGGVSTWRGRAAFRIEFSYLFLLSAETAISKMQPEVLHGVALDLGVAFR